VVIKTHSFTDSEATLQVINKWIGGGVKLSLAKTADADMLKVIIIKLQKRVQAKTGTLLLKVKAHRGCPLNEEADIREEMGRMKPEEEKTWNESTKGTSTSGRRPLRLRMEHLPDVRQSAWTQTVRNRMQQKAGELQTYQG